MKIEQRNTLFLIGLTIIMLTGSLIALYLVVNRHAGVRLNQDLNRSYRVFLQSQQQSFSKLTATGRVLSQSVSLTEALLMKDGKSLRRYLKTVLERTGADLVAVYYGENLSLRYAVSTEYSLSVNEALVSPQYKKPVFKVQQGHDVAYGHAAVQAHVLGLVATGIRQPTGASTGVLLLGKKLDKGVIGQLKQMINAEIVLLRGDGVIASSIDNPVLPVNLLKMRIETPEQISFNSVDKSYVGKVFPVLDEKNGNTVARLLLAFPQGYHWQDAGSMLSEAGLYIVLLLLVVALAAIWLSRLLFTHPIKQLASTMREVSSGQRLVKVEGSRDDELGDLISSFNIMIGNINKARQDEELSRDRFYSFAESSSDWLWETGYDGTITYISGNVEPILGYSPHYMVGKKFSEVFPRDNLQLLNNRIDPGHTDEKAIKDLEVWITSAEGMRLCMRLNALAWFDTAGFAGYRGTARDVSKLKNDEEKLLHLSNRDHLTGLMNRRRIMEELNREIRVAESQRSTGAVALLDIDHFKLVNDTAGHAAGDEVIVQVGNLLRRMARDSDSVARLSGAEYAVVMSNIPFELARKRCVDMQAELEKLRPTYSGKIMNVTGSFGLVEFPFHGANAIELMAKADAAMYRAKNAGRNRVHVYSEGDSMQEDMGSQLTWKDRIHEALKKDLLDLYYQPIASSSGDLIGRYECLVRMQSETGGIYTPGSFIPTAEEFGLINQIDRVVVTKAIAKLAELGNDSGITFSINLSGLSVGDPDMLKLISELLDRHQVDHQRVIFEVTESAACDDISRAIDFINNIQSLGCRIALDDFGVGFSSFSYLKHLHPDVLKIDGSFIRDIQNNAEDQLFVKALVEVAKGMGMKTVAEFVESAETMAEVERLGVDYVQGYHISKPLTEPNASSATRTLDQIMP